MIFNEMRKKSVVGAAKAVFSRWPESAGAHVPYIPCTSGLESTDDGDGG